MPPTNIHTQMSTQARVTGPHDSISISFPAGSVTVQTTVYIEDMTIATTHATDPNTHFFHLMFPSSFTKAQELQFLSWLADQPNMGFNTFYNMLATSNQLFMPVLPSGTLGWLSSLQTYFYNSYNFFSTTLTDAASPKLTTCFVMIVTAIPGTVTLPTSGTLAVPGTTGTPGNPANPGTPDIPGIPATPGNPGVVLSIGMTAGVHSPVGNTGHGHSLHEGSPEE